MKRRVFIQNTSLSALGLGVFGLSGCSTQTEKGSSESTEMKEIEPFFKLSLAQWSIHRMIREDGLDPYLFAEKAKGWGFDGLEYVSQLYVDKFDASATLNTNIEKMVKQLNAKASQTGMENLILMVDLDPEIGDMAFADAQKRQAAVEAHFPWVDATAALGCHSMRINMFGTFDATEWKSASIDALGKLGEYAAKSNVNIIIENHGWLTSNAALLMEVINEVNMPNCGTLPDFGNFCTKRKDGARWGECEEEYDKYLGIQELMPAAKAVSAKSYDFDENGNETTIDYARMLDIVKSAGYSGYIGVEYEGNRLSEEEGILATKDLLLKLAKTPV